MEAHADLAQVAGLTRSVLTEGFEAGVEQIELRTGSGLRVGFAPARGLDPLWAEYKGLNLAWRGANGIVHPAHYEETNLGWLRGFPGGLLTTCGLASFGPPCEDGGEYYGLHDRISYVPAREVSARPRWVDEETCLLEVRGTLRQTRLFGPNLRLDRVYSAPLGGNVLRLRDTITNDGFRPEPAVILYHCNFGFPLLEAGSRVLLNASQSRPRDEAAASGKDTWMELEAPTPQYAERCYFHDVSADADGLARAGIWNPRLNLGCRLTYNPAQLPWFTQWKMLGAGAYVCGLEPSNAPLTSRAQLRASHQLPLLEPGESVTIDLEWEVTESSW